MRKTTRALTPAESRSRYRGISILERKTRRQAELEAEAGTIEAIEFGVTQAWNLITCPGPPCCPNTWLLETTDHEFLRLESWHFLKALDGRFPGDHVTVLVWPMTKRILEATATGEPIIATDTPEALADFDCSSDVEIYANEATLPPRVAASIRAAAN
jgi:hypothetical protein